MPGVLTEDCDFFVREKVEQINCMSTSSSKVQFLKNVGSGWMAVFVTGIVGFLMLPLNLRYLGEEVYGISVLAVSTLMLFSFLKMGMQPALLRFFSRAIVTNNHEEFKSLSSMTQLLLGGLGFVGAIGFLCVYPWFVSIYEVPETVQRDLLVLFFAIAIDFWSNLFLIPFITIIQSSNRFDIGNIQQCIAKILRIVVLFIGYFFYTPSLLILAASVFAGTVYQLLSLILLAYKIYGKSIFFRSKSLRWSLLPPLFSFSVWVLISQVFVTLAMQIPVLIIGKTLGVDMVAAFSPAILLSTFFSSILIQISAPLVPVASKDIAENGGKNLGRWAILIGEIVACIGCSIIVVFALLGSEIITVWLGESFAWTGTIVTITVMGIVFAGIQTSNYRLELGGNTSIAPFALSAVAVAVVASLGTLLGTVYGGWSLLEVAVFITLVHLIRNTFFLAISYSWRLDYCLAEYTWHVHVKPLLLGLSIIGFIFLLKRLFAFSLVCIPALDISSQLVTCFYSLQWQFTVSMVYISTLALSSLLVAYIYLSLYWKFVIRESIRKSMLGLVTNKFVSFKRHAK